MKRISLVLLASTISLLIIGCKTSAPLEITKVWIVEKLEIDAPVFVVDSPPKTEKNFQPLTLTYSKDFNYSVEFPAQKTAHRLIAVEVRSKSEAELKFKRNLYR